LIAYSYILLFSPAIKAATLALSFSQSYYTCLLTYNGEPILNLTFNYPTVYPTLGL
jgi:hypothetical protein